MLGCPSRTKFWSSDFFVASVKPWTIQAKGQLWFKQNDDLKNSVPEGHPKKRAISELLH